MEDSYVNYEDGLGIMRGCLFILVCFLAFAVLLFLMTFVK